MENSEPFSSSSTNFQNSSILAFSGKENKLQNQIDCLVQSDKELKNQHYQNPEKILCSRTWDNIYCWPPTPAGETISRPCSEVINMHYSGSWVGNAFRTCSLNGTWLWGNWTNYTECLDYFDDEEDTVQNNSGIGSESTDFISIVNLVKYILFIGSIISLITLSISLFIFYYFRNLRCDRIKLHVHLMVSLALRFILLILVTEPFIFNRSSNYRNVDLVCKVVLSLLMYATVASINWMFIQGHYLNSRLTTNVFDRGIPLRVYYVTGWILPLFLIITWASVMETYHPVHCWTNYSKQNYIWILVGPMILALSINLLFLFNIMRILLTKIQLATVSSDSAQLKRAVKATFVLFPLLGINNLLFVYNPGGQYENTYLIANTILQSSQGFFVSLLYCFINKDVREAIRREYRRFPAVQNLTRTRSIPTNPNTCISIVLPMEITKGNPNSNVTKCNSLIAEAKVSNENETINLSVLERTNTSLQVTHE